MDSEPVKAFRCKIAVQFCTEWFYLLMSISTFEDAGYAGIPASCIGLIATSALLGRCIQAPLVYTVVCLLNPMASVTTIAHVALTIWRAATVSNWCCSTEDTDPHGVAALLYVLALFYTSVGVFRITLILGSVGAASLRHAPARTGATVIPLGQPVSAVPVSEPQVGLPVVGVRVDRPM